MQSTRDVIGISISSSISHGIGKCHLTNKSTARIRLACENRHKAVISFQFARDFYPWACCWMHCDRRVIIEAVTPIKCTC